MNKEEQEVFKKIIDMKKENELLMVIYEEVEELIKSEYKGSFMAEETKGIFFAVNEYKGWRTNEKKS